MFSLHSSKLLIISSKMHREIMFVSMVMAIVCLSISIVPSSAQLPGAGVCWEDVTNCILKNGNSNKPEFDLHSTSFNATEYICCPLMRQTFDSDKSCFCSVSTYLHSPSGYNFTEGLISICKLFDSLDDFDATCGGVPTEAPTTSPDLTPDIPDTTPPSPDLTPNVPDTTETPADAPSSDLTPDIPDTTETPADASSPDNGDLGACWDAISKCQEKNSNESSTNPEFDVDSPSFDISKFLCCPLIKQAADTDRPCFCTIKQLLHSNANVITVLTKCNVIQSLASFDTTCSGTQTKTKAGRLAASANGMVLPESLSRYSAIFIILAYFFY